MTAARIGRVAAHSDTGRRRRRNEDAYVMRPPLFAVADGMGGAQAGEVASRLAAEALNDDGGGGVNGTGADRVTELVQTANRRVYERASADESVMGMGTTVTMALVGDDEVTFGHVGDSRAYLIRDGELRQLTDDHSLVAELIRSGKLSPEEAESHPQRSVITRALGTDPDVDVDVFSVPVSPGDLFLLCSDGLTTMVGDDEILDTVAQHRDDLDGAARALVGTANRGGGEDNITVVFFEIDTGDTVEMPAIADEPTVVDTVDEDTLDELDDVPVVEAAAADAPPKRSSTGARLLALLGVLALLAVLVLVLVLTIGR
jgi:serine/threonine protein phosphatase PrpC